MGKGVKDAMKEVEPADDDPFEWPWPVDEGGEG
jgi:hypothetical protein